MPEQALVMLEVQDELRYLFEAPALADVQGAGALLESLGRFTLPALTRRREFGGAGILAGGRRYVATFPGPEIAHRFTAEARRTYRQRTLALRLLAAQQGVDADDLVTRFGEHLRGVRQESERAGLESLAVAAAYSPELRWCDACRLFPAVRVVGDEVICRACSSRRTHLADQDARLTVEGYQTGLAEAEEEDLAGRPVWERLLRWLRDSGALRSGNAAADIGSLAQRRPAAADALGDGLGRCAVVIAEINDLQPVLEHFSDSQRALRSAARVNRLLDEALFEAVASIAWRDRTRPFNFQVLLAGGDRLVCLLPADVALPVIARTLRTFEGQSAVATEGRRLSFSAGVGLAPSRVSLGTLALQARAALAAARRDFLNPSAAALRRSWRSQVAFGHVATDGLTSLNLGELERSMAHARVLRRNGILPAELQPAALQSGSEGRLASLTADWTDPQRRAIAAVARDLSVGTADADQANSDSLWRAISELVPWVTLDAPASLARSRPDLGSRSSTTAERSA